jgi:ABC-type sugar transport system substrate-binding protein
MTGVLAFVRSLALIAAVAFLAGFAGYLAIGRPSAAAAQPEVKPVAVSSGPASDDWNLPKHI